MSWLNPNVPERASMLLENIQDLQRLADFLAATLNISIDEQLLLERQRSQGSKNLVATANQPRCSN